MMRTVPYAFRIRFVLAETVRLGLNHPEITMASSEVDGEEVVLRCTDPDDEISKARTLLLSGQPYESDEDARAAGSRWLDWLQIAFADCNVAADSGTVPSAPVGGHPTHMQSSTPRTTSRHSPTFTGS
jgi:hypothetical protein